MKTTCAYIILCITLYSNYSNSQNNYNQLQTEANFTKYIYSFNENVSIESAKALDFFFISKKGIANCETDLINKKTIITLNAPYDKKFLDLMFESANNHFFIKNK